MVVRKLAWLCLASLAGLLLSSSALAQSALKNNDLSFDGFYQFTSTASGNGITDRTSKSAGAAGFFRHSYHWWLGYEAGYEYTRFTEHYTGQVFGIQHNQHEFSGSYYVHGPHTLGGIEPFALAGASAVIFSPSLNGGQNVSWQAHPGINYGAGVNVPLLTSYFGLRVEYRGVFYKAPDFGEADLTTNAWRNTSEPTAGIYFRF